MKKTFLKFAAVAAVLAFTSGCASQGGFQGAVNKVGGVASSAAGGIADAGGSFFKGYESGTKVTEETLAKIEPGMTMGEVKTLIGASPNISVGSNNTEIWTYDYLHMPHFGANTEEKTVIRFDSEGSVLYAEKSGGNSGAKTGNPLLDAARAQGQL